MQRPQIAPDWLARRDYPDLAARAERALRAAGLAWHDEPVAERHLAEALAEAPDHLAVAIAHYRYFLYKHRFAEALPHLERCLAIFARAVWGDAAKLPAPHEVPRLDDAPSVRAWLWARQAYGYLLLRLGRESDGISVLERLVEADARDQTKTRALLDVVARAGEDPDEYAD